MRRMMVVAMVLGCIGLGAGLEAGEKIKAVIVTGGHKFDRQTFFPLFDGHEDITWVEAEQKDHSEIFEDIAGWDYDVIVLYNMTQQISEKRQENFLKLLDRGVGVVALHHAMFAFQDWPEYRKIIGGKCYSRDTVEDGVERPKSGYKHGVRFKIAIADKDHPITRGIEDFEVEDETYCPYTVAPDAHILLTTDEPTSEKAVGWVSAYPKSRVCCILMGHGPTIFSDPSYRRLVAQAIRWAAGRAAGD